MRFLLTILPFALVACSVDADLDVQCTSDCEDEKQVCYDECDTECANPGGDEDEGCDTDCKTTCDETNDECTVSCEGDS